MKSITLALEQVTGSQDARKRLAFLLEVRARACFTHRANLHKKLPLVSVVILRRSVMRFLSCAVVSVMTVLWFASPALAVSVTIFEESIAGDADGSHPGVTTAGLTDGSNVIVGSLASPAVDDYFRVPVGGGTATITDMTLTVDGDGSSGVTSVYVLFFDSEGNFVGQTSPPLFGVPFSDQSLFSGTGFGPSTPGFSEWANNQTEFFFQISSAGQSGMANNNYSLAIDSTVDSDGDGVGDSTDAFPVNPNESVDTDGDGTGDNGDPCPIDPNDDSDGDGSCDSADAFPLDPSETADTDGDGTGDNADAFPFDASEETDTDGDGIGNNADTDDDSDGISDAIEIAIGFDPIKSDSNDNGTADGDALVARLQNCADEVVPILTPPGSSVLIGLLLGFGAARLHARRGRRAH